MSFDQLLGDLKSSLEKKTSVTLTGNMDLDLPSIISVAKNQTKVSIDLPKNKFKLFNKVIAEMLKQVKSGTPIYGTTTSYGGRARLVLNKGDEQIRLLNATKLSDAIVHVDVSTGPKLSVEVVRAAMLIRLNMLLSGASAIRLNTLDILRQVINAQITPLVGQYGSVGASGDLAQNGRVLSCLLQRPEVMAIDKNGKVVKANKALRKLGIAPVKLQPKEGLALVNGDNFSSAACLLLVHESLITMFISLGVSALTIQALLGSDRNFHPFLSKMRPHGGQDYVSTILRKLLKDSLLGRQEMTGHMSRAKGESVQDPYSIRCLPQYYGPDFEALGLMWETLKININSVSDNPLWVLPGSEAEGEKPFQWISGGNFLAMHMSECLDRLRKVLVHIVKQNDRHLARLTHPTFSRGLPANLSDKSAVSQATFKGLQTQMGMYEVYSSLLVNPASTAFGTHEEFNQDLTSHAPASSILARELIKIAKYAVASNFIAACQAIDLRGGQELLSPATKPLYLWLRKLVPYIKKERPLGNFIEKVSESLGDKILLNEIMKSVEK